MISRMALNQTGAVALRVLLVVVGVFLFSSATFAAATGITLSGLQTHISKSATNIAEILTKIALVAGIGFIFASFFKFHQHKMNPTQIPLSQGITLLVIGAALAVFPMLLNTATKGVFSASVTKLSSTSVTKIIGGKT